VEEYQRTSLISELFERSGTRGPNAACVLGRHAARRVAILDAVRRLVCKDDHIEFVFEPVGLQIGVTHAGVRKTKILEKPARPAFIHIGLPRLIERDAGTPE